MGIFDFLKKFFVEEQNKKEIKAEASLEEIKKENNTKSDEIKAKSKQIIAGIIPLLEISLLELKSVNLEKRRENEQLKEIVKKNLQQYIFYLEKLINNLKELDQTANLDNYLARINTIFNNFTKNSAKIYQKANILIGKELGKVKVILNNFTQEYNLIIKENQENNLKKDELNKKEEKYNKISNLEKIEEQIKEKILDLKKKKEKNQEEILEKTEEKTKILNSQEYKKELEEKNQREKEIEKFEKEITSSIGKVNLKELAKKYHDDEKKHKMIQNYRENYKRAIWEDKEKVFEKIIKESFDLDINLSEINEKILNLKNYIGLHEIKLKNIEEEIQRIKKEIEEIDETKKNEEKKLEKFKIEKEGLTKILIK